MPKSHGIKDVTWHSKGRFEVGSLFRSDVDQTDPDSIRISLRVWFQTQSLSDDVWVCVGITQSLGQVWILGPNYNARIYMP